MPPHFTSLVKCVCNSYFLRPRVSIPACELRADHRWILRCDGPDMTNGNKVSHVSKGREEERVRGEMTQSRSTMSYTTFICSNQNGSR